MRKDKNKLPSIDWLKSILSYDREDGSFVWLVARGPSKSGTPAGSITKSGYLVISINHHKFMGHQIAWAFEHEEWPSHDIDHRDLNKSNNVFSNLRPSIFSLNGANTRSRHKLNVLLPKGVTIHRDGRYQSQIRKDGKNFYLGLFNDPQEAHRIYVEKAKELFGEFARVA